MNWTSEQKKAIDSREKNLLVAAAAGSGKTAVLVERITQMVVEDNFDVDKMLIVTFTNAAAQEMRSRIHKSIAEKLATADDYDLSARLERQSILLNGASIMTFHAFCLSVLRRHFSKIDLEPNFREGNEQELKLLQQEVIKELFESKYAAQDKDFIKFAENFGGDAHGDSDLHELIIALYDFSQSRPYPDEWLNSLAEIYENPDAAKIEGDESWLDFVIDFSEAQAKNIIDTCREECIAAKNIADEISLTYKIKIGEKNFEDDLRIFNGLHAAKNFWDKLREKLREKISLSRFDATRKFPDNLIEIKNRLQKIREGYKKRLENLQKFVRGSKSELVAEMKNLAPSVRQLAKVTIDFEKAFAAAKRERNIIDFDDMEHLALKIFNVDSHVAATYREKFQVIMVDEYQDTNGVQEEIIGKIVGRNNFFAVGDVKQSIYRFRNADPEIFLQKYKSYPAHDESERIDLSKNFRSRRQVVDAVNFIFRHLMTEAATEIDYNKEAELNFGATNDYPADKNIFDENAEFYAIDLKKETKKNRDEDDDEEEDDDAEELDNLGLEIQLIAERINSMIHAEKKVWDSQKKIYRPLEFRDIVILVRAIDGKATKIIDVLQKNQIPAYAVDKGGYFQAPEVQTILSLLSVLDNARQDIPLAVVMLSPIGGFSAEDLAQLRIGNRKADLYTLISENVPADLVAKCKKFLIKINLWRERARQVSVPELLSAIYRETGYYDYFGRTPEGKIPQANLRVLIDRAAEYESTAFRGLSRFIQFIKKIRDRGNDLSAARTLGENENVVRIMTIHKSKGLEFPVVFVAQLGKRFNTKDINGKLVIHRKLGVGIFRTEMTAKGAANIPTFAREIIRRKAKLEMLAEELRILYVAFTRAREKLILVGTIDNRKFLDSNFAHEKISTYDIQNVTRPIDWLFMAKDFAADVINFKIVDKFEINLPKIEELVPEIMNDAEIFETVEKIPPSPLQNIPAKLSVTELKRRIAEEDFQVEDFILTAESKSDKPEIYRRPNFLQKVEMTGAEFGTIMHSVMQHLDLRGKLDSRGISAQIDKMIDDKILTDEQSRAVKKNISRIEKFFAGELGQKILNAEEIYRELPFSHYIDAEKIGGGKIFTGAAGEKIFIQGIIDLLFKDTASGKWILLDYKTDRNNSDEHFRREYREQINFYVRAVETLVGLKISEKYLYLLTVGRLIDMRENL